ncbi:RNA polymerase sigma factor, partial [Algoriphagus aestuarii]|nr:RNA polymerase sigma factor [Algoriphagus aestuarii]
GEIAAQLDLALGTVKSRIHEGRKRVRQALAVN